MIWEALVLAAGLGMDAMSVCMAVGVRWHGPRQKFRLAWHMGLFQFMMPLFGWALGKPVATHLAGWGKYLAASLVFAIGAKMLYEALKNHPGLAAEKAEHAVEQELRHKTDPTRGWSLIAMSVATSIDALVVGFSLGLRSGQQPIYLTSLIIGVVAAGMALAGVIMGQRLGKALGKWAEIAGAAVLMALAVVFVVL